MRTQCPHCKSIFNAPDNSVGKKAKCPKCNDSFDVIPIQAEEPTDNAQPDKCKSANITQTNNESSPKEAKGRIDENKKTKCCPYCGENILEIAKKCRYCGEYFSNRSGLLVNYKWLIVVLVIALAGLTGWVLSGKGDKIENLRNPINKTEEPEQNVKNDTVVVAQDTVNKNEVAVEQPAKNTMDMNHADMLIFLTDVEPLVNEFNHMAQLHLIYGGNLSYSDYMKSVLEMFDCLQKVNIPDNEEARQIMKHAQAAVENYRKGKSVFKSDPLSESISGDKIDKKNNPYEYISQAAHESTECLKVYLEVCKKYGSHRKKLVNNSSF